MRAERMNGTDGVEYSRPGSNIFFCFASIDTPMPNIVSLKNDASSIHQPPISLFIYSTFFIKFIISMSQS